MTAQSLMEMVRKAVEKIDHACLETEGVEQKVEEAIKPLIDAGIRENESEEEHSELGCLRWYAGQVISAARTPHLRHHLNSVLNMMVYFEPASYRAAG